jgi:crotonobetainyl-CoA:carnitine CoA-transferase CaiB-like acyl-CoA transferase
VSEGILAGLRVVDLAHGIPGPVAAMQLGEAGAEVVKVEPPAGDPDRGTPGFAVWNRGKKSVVIDLTTPTGRTELEKLLASADVVIHDYPPSKARALGLAPEDLARRFPDLVVSAVTGWPGAHPNAELPATESLVLARLGLMDEQPGHRPGPVFVRLPFGSWMTAWFCAIGVMARLIHRDRGHPGGTADTSVVQGALGPMTMHWCRAETPSANLAKGLDKNVAIAIHQCSDGKWLHVHYSPDRTPWMAEALEALGPEGVAAANARWGKNHTAVNFGANKKIIATRPQMDWLRHFWEHDVAAQPAAEFGEIYFDEQARANGYVVEIDDPQFGKTLQPGPAYDVAPPAQPGGALRTLGADTGDVLDSARAKAPRTGLTPGSAAPLTGLKVLDFGAYLAGPYAPMLLSDLGADVIKVEPCAGDPMRYIESTFCGAQRGKRSIALQLSDPRAKPALEALAKWADVAHYNLRMPAVRKLGLDYGSLSAVNPQIITCHVSSYGARGPRADWPGYDQMFQSSCGWEVEDGGQGNPPLWLRFGMTDHLGAVSSVFGLLLAVYHRDRTGQGQNVAASLLGATILSTSETIVHPDGALEAFPRLNSAQTGVSDEHRIYQAGDGWVAVAALKPAEAAAFRKLAGADPQAFFSGLSVQAATQALDGARVPNAPVKQDQKAAFLDDPANRAANLTAVYDHPVYGRFEQLGSFWDFGDLPIRLRRAPPTVGQHSREILDEVGVEPALAARLLDEGVTVVTRIAGVDPSVNKRR